MLKSHIQAQFTADDLQFVVLTLARSEKDAVSLVDLLSDPDVLEHVLQHDRVVARLLEDARCLRVSPALYFYVLTRRALRDGGLDHADLADYLARVLISFSSRKGFRVPCSGESPGAFSTYFTDMLTDLNRASGQEAFLIRLHMANYALFLSGIFAERIRAHARLHGAPNLSFYENVGATNYHLAAEDRMARTFDLRAVCERLASEFCRVRRALNHLAENLFHMGPNAGEGTFRLAS